jgi:hypothetical protein
MHFCWDSALGELKGVQVGQLCNVLSTDAKRGRGPELTFWEAAGISRCHEPLSGLAGGVVVGDGPTLLGQSVAPSGVSRG